MTVYINYINQQKTFLFENEGDEDLDDSSFMKFDLKLSDIFNVDYIKEKIKEKSNLIFLNMKEKFFTDEIKEHFTDNMEEKILNKIQENSNSFEIKYSDVNKIYEFCKLEETKLFLIKSEDNYLCLPFNDEKKFKAIKIASYYDAEFEIADEESLKLLKIILEFKKTGKRTYKIGSGDKGISIDFLNYDESRGWTGRFKESKKTINIVIRPDLNYLKMYSTLVHEYIHYKDIMINKDKFTNTAMSYIIMKLGEKFKKGDVASYEDLKEFLTSKTAVLLKIDDISAIRYLVAILHKKKLIQYLPNDYTKIKFISNLPTLENSNDYYYTDDVELNTHMINLIHEILFENERILFEKISEEELNQIIKNYVADNYMTIFSEYEKNNPDIQWGVNKESDDLRRDIVTNYFNKVKEKLPLYIKNLKNNKEKFNELKNDYLTNESEKSSSNQNVSESLLRQYISLLIT